MAKVQCLSLCHKSQSWSSLRPQGLKYGRVSTWQQQNIARWERNKGSQLVTTLHCHMVDHTDSMASWLCHRGCCRPSIFTGELGPSTFQGLQRSGSIRINKKHLASHRHSFLNSNMGIPAFIITTWTFFTKPWSIDRFLMSWYTPPTLMSRRCGGPGGAASGCSQEYCQVLLLTRPLLPPSMNQQPGKSAIQHQCEPGTSRSAVMLAEKGWGTSESDSRWLLYWKAKVPEERLIGAKSRGTIGTKEAHYSYL